MKPWVAAGVSVIVVGGLFILRQTFIFHRIWNPALSHFQWIFDGVVLAACAIIIWRFVFTGEKRSKR